MDILVLAKRQYTSRDLLGDRYGRLYELPEALAQRGHHVRGLATSYRPRPSAAHTSAHGVRWHDSPLGLTTPWHWWKFFRSSRQPRPDVIWASSDALHCIAAERIGRLLGIPVVLDLYDNYDHFGLTAVPGIRPLYHAACRRAAAITTVSHTLADHIRSDIASGTPSAVIANGVSTRLFHSRPRAQCREALGLPSEATIIGTAGAINASRGIEDLFRAFLHLAEHDENLHLAIAGPQDDTPERFPHPRIINLGVMEWQEVPLLINALDLMVVCNRDDGFGSFCHPLKLVEAIACGVPVCATAVGDTSLILAGKRERLYQPGDHEELASRIALTLRNPDLSVPEIAVADWHQQADLLEKALLLAVSPTATSAADSLGS